MMRNQKIYNFIIFIFMLVSIISLAGAGLEDSRQLVKCHAIEDGTIYVSESQLVPDDNVSNIKIVEKENVLAGSLQLRASRSSFSYRMALSFLCSLAFLSGLFLLAYSQRSVLYSSRYVSKVGYLITYIQDKDGRKRFS